MNTEHIKHNKIRCKGCNDTVESFHRHDFKWCRCGNVAVDGGKEYLKRCFQRAPEIDFEEMSTYYTEDQWKRHQEWINSDEYKKIREERDLEIILALCDAHGKCH